MRLANDEHIKPLTPAGNFENVHHGVNFERPRQDFCNFE